MRLHPVELFALSRWGERVSEKGAMVNRLVANLATSVPSMFVDSPLLSLSEAVFPEWLSPDVSEVEAFLSAYSVVA